MNQRPLRPERSALPNCATSRYNLYRTPYKRRVQLLHFGYIPDSFSRNKAATTNGIRSLRDVLTNDLGLDLTGWTLENDKSRLD